MDYHIRIDNTEGSVFAIGDNAVAHGTPAAPPTVEQARQVLLRELATMRGGLPEHLDPLHRQIDWHAAELQQAADVADPEPGRARRAWVRLTTALAALGVTGAVAFGADLAQIASSVGVLP